MKMRSPLTLTLALIASGCAALPPLMAPGATERASQAAPVAKSGTVVVDLSQLMRFLGQRHVLADGFNTTGITNLRLEARGPGMDTVTSANMAFTNPPSGSLTLEVPQGPNRIFRLQGVDGSGNVLVSLATVANVPSTAAVPLSFDLATTATANVLRRLVEPIESGQTDASGIRTLIQTQDITADLKAYVLKATRYDDATKAVLAGGIDPRFFRANQMAALLYKNGLADIQPKARAGLDAAIQVDAGLSQGTAGKLFVAIRNRSGLPISNEAAVKGEIFDLGRNGNLSTTASGTDDSGTLAFSDVNIGSFDLKLTLPDGTVAWLHEVNVRDTGASYASYAVPATATALPQSANLTAQQVTITENTASHDLLLAWVDSSSIAHVQEYDSSGLPKGADITLGSPSGCKAISACYLPGSGNNDDAYMVSWVTDGGSTVNVGALPPKATVLAKSTSHTTSSATYGVQIVPLGTQDAAVVWADGSNVNVARESWDGAALNAQFSPQLISTGNTQFTAAAGSSTGNLMLAYNAGRTIVSQRTSLNTSGAFALSGTAVTVASNVAPCGSSLSVTGLAAAYDRTLDQYLVGWGSTTSTSNAGYELLGAKAADPTSKLTFQAVLPTMLTSGVAFDVNRSDARLDMPMLTYTAAKSEYLVAFVNRGLNAIQAQRIPAGLVNLPTGASWVTGSTSAPSPTSPAFAYSASSQSYRTIWLTPDAEGINGPVTLGEFKP